MSDVTQYFAEKADDYARYRPTYPVEAVAWILDGLGPAPRVADVGCGTGIAARLLGEQGAVVVGVEPNEGMRVHAEAEGGANVRYVAGTAEATGLADDAVDLVVCAQAFHWFDGEASLREFWRILRPGGRLALMWNVRDDGAGLGAPYAEVVRRAKVDARDRGRLVRSQRSGDPSRSERFAGLRKRAFSNDQVLGWESLLGRARSASYFPPAGPVRDELEAFLREAFDEHAEEGRVVLPQRTEVTLCEAVVG